MIDKGLDSAELAVEGDSVAPADIRHLRHKFRVEQAVLLAKRVGASINPLKRDSETGAISEAFAFFADEESLLIVVRREENQVQIDLALAHGLFHAKGRKLRLLLPTSPNSASPQEIDRSLPTRIRAKWLKHPVEVFGYSDYDAMPELLQPADWEPGGYVEAGVPELARDEWVVDLLSEITERASRWGSIVEAHRKSYWSWHFQGRQVLRMAKTPNKGFAVIAGVNYSVPKGDQPPPITVEITEQPSPELLDLLKAAVILAIRNRFDGRDKQNQEHMLQENLVAKAADLELLNLEEREFPVVRPGGKRAYIDFLAMGKDGNLHVVETKIGPDPMLVLQGLDYWLWVRSHADQLRDRFDLDEIPDVVIDFVVAEKKGVLSRYTRDQLDALSEEVRWRVFQVNDYGLPAKVSVVRLGDSESGWSVPPEPGPGQLSDN